MTKYAIAYAATAIVFLILDGGWLTLVGPRLYRPEIGSLLADQVRLAPAIAFYLMYVAGTVYFAVAPNLAASWPRALIAGALLGAMAYATYDLTCAATMRQWSTLVTVADILWGAFSTGVASVAGVLITRTALRLTGG